MKKVLSILLSFALVAMSVISLPVVSMAGGEDILTSAVDTITTSIQTRSFEAHPVTALIDDDFDGDQLYKSENGVGYDNVDGKAVDLVITMTLKDVYAIDSFKIYENYLSDYGTCTDNVTIQIGTGSNLETAVSGAALNTGADGCLETEFVFDKAYTGDKIVVTLKGGKDARGNSQSHYQIWELEAFGEKVIAREDILTKSVTSIETSIISRNTEAHPITAMLDDSFTGDNLYKSEIGDNDTINGISVDLVITLNLDAYYAIDTFKIYDNYIPDLGVCTDDVTIQIVGADGAQTAIAGGTLNTSSDRGCLETAFVFDKAYTGNKIIVTLKGGQPKRSGGESHYQIWELEAFGEVAEAPVAKEDILTNSVTSIETSIISRNTEAHPITAMLDDSFTGDNLYKSEIGDNDTINGISVDLVITLNLDAYYAIDTFKIYDNYIPDLGVCTDDVTIQIVGADGAQTAIAGGTLNTSSDRGCLETAFVFDKAYTGNKIIVTLKGGQPKRSGGESHYQIWELEAFGEKVEDIAVPKDILPVGVKSIDTSIVTRNEEEHPVTSLIDDTTSRYYKSEKGTGWDDDGSASKPLDITIELLDTYSISSVNIFERYLNDWGNCSDSITVKVGTGDNLQVAISGATLKSGYDGEVVKNELSFDKAYTGDKIVISFAGGKPIRNAESQYQLNEIEAYGVLVKPELGVVATGAVWNGSESDATLSLRIENSTGADVVADVVVASYINDSLVGVSVKTVTIANGGYDFVSNPLDTTGASSYKVMIVDSINTLKPLTTVKAVVK